MSKRKKFVMAAICGNEERWVVQWCKSVMKANPDLIIINLTQFDDNSEVLFRSHIPKDKLVLVKNKWEKSFSIARNQSLEPVPDDTDYVMYLDLDEVITDNSFGPLEEFLTSDEYPPMQVLCNIYNAVSDDSMVASLYYPRIWPHKNASGDLINEHFDGEVHNQLIIGEEHNVYAMRSKVNIYHYGYALDKASMAAKHKRSEELLRKQIGEEETNFFAHLNLAQLLRAKGDYHQALKHGQRVLELVSGKIEGEDSRNTYAFIMAKDQVATCYLAMKNQEEAIRHSEDALKIKPDHLDSIMNMAHAYINLQELDKAEFWLKRYLFVRARYDETKDNTNLILNHLNSSFIALYHLGMICGSKGRIEQALEYYRKTYEEEPRFRDTFIKYVQCLKLLNRQKEMNDEVNAFMRKVPDRAHQVYEYFGDVELEVANIENAKFNFYQALYINNSDEVESEGVRDRIRQKWDCLNKEFGDVSHNYFDTTEKKELLVDRTNAQN